MVIQFTPPNPQHTHTLSATTTGVFNRIHTAMKQNLIRCGDYDGTFFTAGATSRKTSKITKAYITLLQRYFGDTVAQELNCACCKNTLHQIGGLRIITEDNLPQSVFWDPEIVDEDLKGFFTSMKTFTESERTRGPLFSVSEDIDKTLNTATYGVEEAGGFHHMCFQIPARNTITSTRSGLVAFARDFREGHAQMLRTLNDPCLTMDNLTRVINTLRSEMCDRSTFVDKGQLLKWRALLSSALATKRYDNAVWRFQGDGFNPSFWNLRSSVIWELLSDLAKGVDVERAVRAFRRMTASENYQRPTTAPSNLAVQQAEELVASLGIQDSLKRRQAVMEDLLPYAIWVAPEVKPVEESSSQNTGVFSHLKTKTPPRPSREASSDFKILSTTQVPATNMSWRKFSEEILPITKDLWIKLTERIAPFFGFMTEEIPGSNPIIIWDKDYARCPVSWYTYSTPIPNEALDLSMGNVIHVDAIVPNLSIRKELKEEDRRLIGGSEVPFFVTKTVRDILYPTKGARLFPEILRTDIKNNVGLRRVLEAYSNNEVVVLPENYVGSFRPCKSDPTKSDNATLTILVETENEPRWIRITHID